MTGTSLLDGLKAWNSQATLEAQNAYLMLYAHMGDDGISPRSRKDRTFCQANVISWAELAGVLPRRVHTCWLVGCNSCAVLTAWKCVGGPVLRRLLVTLESEKWTSLVQFFADEIGLYPVTYPEDMPARLCKALPKLGPATRYYEPTTASGWKLCFPQP